MFVVNISRSFNCFSSHFFLDNWISSNRVIFNDSVFSRDKSNLHIFFFNDWLNDRLVNIFIRRKRNFSNIYQFFDLSRSVYRFQSVLYFTSFNDIKLFGKFLYSWFDDILIVNNVAINAYCPGLPLITCLNWKTSGSLNYSLFFLLEFRNQLFDCLINFWLNYNSLSHWLNLVFSDDSRLFNDPFSDNLRLCLKSLSDYPRLYSNIFWRPGCSFEIGPGELNLLRIRRKLILLHLQGFSCKQDQSQKSSFHL